MNIALYSHEGFLRLICYCITFGFAAGAAYCIICALKCIRHILYCKDHKALKSWAMGYYSDRSRHSFACDFLSILIISIALLLSTFLSNNGDFRFIGIPALLIGYVIGFVLLRKLVLIAFSVLLYIIKRALEIALSPIIYSINIVVSLIKKVYTIIKKRRKTIIIAKYTEKKYKDLITVKQNGLLAHKL